MNEVEISEAVKEATLKLLRKAEVSLPLDVEKKLREAYESEDNEIAKIQLKTILENVDVAEKLQRPICQDTGSIIFYVTVGDEFRLRSGIKSILQDAVRAATIDVPLRPNVVHPISRKNTGDNVGLEVPAINFSLVPGDFLEISVLIKGSGCENMNALGMLNPTNGIEGIEDFVLNSVIRAGGRPCPPLILGIGIGGTSRQAMALAEKALLRPIDLTHPEKSIEKIEKDLVKKINETGIGPMGLGGRTTSLAVNIEYAFTHTASLPVAINFSCWCLRRASVRILNDGTAIPI